MKGKQIVAIDVGSSNVVITVGEVHQDDRIEILGIVSERIEGINAGRVENSEMAGRAVKSAKERIETKLNIKITEAYAGLSGDYIRCVQVTDHVYVQDELGNGSNQITERDMEDLNRRMNSVKLPDDREEIIAMEPIRYKVDDREVQVPVGAYGYMLSATYNFVLVDKSMRDRLNTCLQRQGIKVKAFTVNALISHLAVATTEEMDEGCVVVDLGGGVTDVTVVLNNKVRHIASIPIGTESINSDICAYGIPANYVENLKIKCGSAIAELADDEKIVFQSARRGVPKSILRRNLVRIIESRLKEIAEWVRREIKEAGCGSRFRPTVLLTGGGAMMPDIEKLFARELELEEVRAVYPEYGFTEGMTEHITTSAYATAASLLIFGAKLGSCDISVRQNITVPRPEVQHPKPVINNTPASGGSASVLTPVTPDNGNEDKKDGSTDTPIMDGGDTPTTGLWGWAKKKFEAMSNSFAGSDDTEKEF